MAGSQEEYSRSSSPKELLMPQYVEAEWPNLSENTWLCTPRIGTETHTR